MAEFFPEEQSINQCEGADKGENSESTKTFSCIALKIVLTSARNNAKYLAYC
jgi:hypothetical protein